MICCSAYNEAEDANFSFIFTVKRNGKWTTSKEIRKTVLGLPPLDPVVIHVDDSIEAGEDFGIVVDPVENATSYGYEMYQSDRHIRSNSGITSIGELRINGYELDPGNYSIKVWAYSDDYATSASEKDFSITGSKPKAPSASVDKANVYTGEYYTFSIDTTDADALVVKYNYSSGTGISIQGDATNYEYALYKPDGTRYTSYTTSIIGKNTYPGYNFEPGEYTVKVWAYSDDYATSTSQKTFTITGSKAPAPTVSVDKSEFYTNETRPIITITAQGAEAIRCKNGDVLAVGEDGTATYSPYMYIYSGDEREYSFSFCAVINDAWTAWSEPLTVKIKKTQEPEPEPLDEPVIHLPETFLAGRDFTFSFDAVDGAASYEAYITRYYTDSNVYSSYSATPGTDLTVSGRSLTAGRYMAKVYAKATERTTSSSQVEFRVTGERGEAPQVTTDKEDYVAGETITFSLESGDADELFFGYSFTGNYSSSGSRTIQPVGNNTEWTYTFPKYNCVETYSFTICVKKDDLWSKATTITIVVPAQQPSEPGAEQVEEPVAGQPGEPGEEQAEEPAVWEEGPPEEPGEESPAGVN